MGVTAILVATGRLDRLKESIASFLAQTYEDKQLIVFNTCFRQQLFGEHPNVVFINSKVQTVPMRGKNSSVENAKYDVIAVWSEVDCYLPNHLARIYEQMAGREWCWFEKEFQSDHRRHLRVDQGSESVFAFTKSAWQKVGGFKPGINGADDRNFIARITKDCAGIKVPTAPNEITFIRLGSDDARAACKPSILSGKIKVDPALSRDYVNQVRQFLTGKIDNRICVVELGRYGDIINILPFLQMVAEEYETPSLCVGHEFADLLEGVSYVKPYVLPLKNEELGQALAVCREEFQTVINAQIWGRGWQQTRITPAYNMESWANCGILNRFKDDSLRPLFDRRDPAREKELTERILGKHDGRPIILVNVKSAISSPCPHCAPIFDEIKTKWGADNIIVDLSQFKAHRLYDFLGLFEIASCLVCIDSSFIHLAGATGIGIVAIKNPKQWAGTVVRRNLVVECNYEAINMVKIHEGIATCLQCYPAGSPMKLSVKKPSVGRVFNLIDKFEDNDAKSIARKSHAVKSQDDLYENGILIPLHIWEYPRTADKVMGDPRKLPFLRDLLVKFMEVSEGNDICLWSNDDTILHPRIVEYVKFHCSVYGACSFFRSDFSAQPPSLELHPEDYARYSNARHIGRDAFAFSREWLRQNFSEIPDFVLGASGWDLCMAALIRLTFGIKTTGANLGENIFPAEPINGYVGHIAHHSLWNLSHTALSPSNAWNGALFYDWASLRLPDLKFTPEKNLAQ